MTCASTPYSEPATRRLGRSQLGGALYSCGMDPSHRKRFCTQYGRKSPQRRDDCDGNGANSSTRPRNIMTCGKRNVRFRQSPELNLDCGQRASLQRRRNNIADDFPLCVRNRFVPFRSLFGANVSITAPVQTSCTNCSASRFG